MVKYRDSGNKRTILWEAKAYEWHRDEKDRIIKVIEGQGWQLQYNGDFPIELIEGNTYRIPAYLYHRVIRGVGNLRIEIDE